MRPFHPGRSGVVNREIWQLTWPMHPRIIEQYQLIGTGRQTMELVHRNTIVVHIKYLARGYNYRCPALRTISNYRAAVFSEQEVIERRYPIEEQPYALALDFPPKMVLIMKMQFTCSPVPEFNTSRQSRARRTKQTRNRLFLHKTLFEKFGKRVDGAKCECSLGNLSPLEGWFFEIYFVRLIGTPNQHYSR